MVKTRGLKEAKVKLGDLERIISKMLKTKKKVRVFESGFGYGKVMVELKRKFGDQIDITGMNYLKMHGDKKKVIFFAVSEGLIDKGEVGLLKDVKVIFGDAGKKLPFRTGSIDLVYSQTSAYLYEDKMHFFEEVARVLSKEGVGLITAAHEKSEKDIPPGLKKILQIYEGGKEVGFEKFIKRFKGIRLIRPPNGKKAVEIKSGKLDFGLNLVGSLNLRDFCERWFGLVSIYAVKGGKTCRG
jgi:ubiquinone/menaquinone biosynthesis C-methylase UbiE